MEETRKAENPASLELGYKRLAGLHSNLQALMKQFVRLNLSAIAASAYGLKVRRSSSQDSKTIVALLNIKPLAGNCREIRSQSPLWTNVRSASSR